MFLSLYVNPSTVEAWLPVINTALISLFGTGVVIYGRIMEMRSKKSDDKRTEEHQVISKKLDTVSGLVNGPLTAALTVGSVAAAKLCELAPTAEHEELAQNAKRLLEVNSEACAKIKKDTPPK